MNKKRALDPHKYDSWMSQTSKVSTITLALLYLHIQPKEASPRNVHLLTLTQTTDLTYTPKVFGTYHIEDY